MTPNLTAKLLPIFVSVILFSAQLAPLPWNESLENAALDLQFTLRGERSLSEEILFVYLGPEDVSALGGWPITRDYYAYIIHILGERHAQTIAFDLLFGRPGTQYPEHDEMLANMISLSPAVCLPISYQKFDMSAIIGVDGLQLYKGRQTLRAFPALRRATAAEGFSNLGSDAVIRRVPLIAREGDSLALSFGVEMARRFRQLKPPAAVAGNRLHLGTDGEDLVIPVDDHGRIILNHFGGLTRVRRMGFVELLQRYQDAPDSLSFNGQLVLIGVTHTGVPALHATPFASDLPSSLIHATVAENIIHQNFIRPLPAALAGLLVLAMTLLPLFLPPERSPFLLAAVTAVLFLGAAFVLFTYAYRLAPLFYPLGGFALSLMLTRRHRRSQQENQLTSLHATLRQQLSEKEHTLSDARDALETLEETLQARSVETESAHQQIARQRAELQKLENEVRDLQSYIVPQKTHAPGEFREIIYSPESPMKAVLDLVQRIREEDIPVLITGETGTGKEMIARAIHRTGRRSARPFVAVNCGALPETLLESELFGHEKGSFTGAQSQRRGRFELADGGTIFLDEIAETTAAFQARLLRVLQEGTFERVGGEKTLRVDVRIIAAGNSDLQAEIENNTFRADLFYRLNGFPISLPQLRERPGDIPLLAAHFLKKHAPETAVRFSENAMRRLQQYRWPGNVRELENAVRRAAILAGSEQRPLIRESDLPAEINLAERSAPEIGDIQFQPLEDQILSSLRALKFSRSAITQTARALGNRDRGTITEYLRGICFQELVAAGFDTEHAAAAIAGNDDPQMRQRVLKKIRGYIENLYPLPDIGSDTPENASQYRGLPKKYHDVLTAVIHHLHEKST